MAAILGVSCGAGSLQAADFYWRGTAATNATVYTNTLNWNEGALGGPNPAAPPTATDNIIGMTYGNYINLGGPLTTIANFSTTNNGSTQQYIYAGVSSGTFNITGTLSKAGSAGLVFRDTTGGNRTTLIANHVEVTGLLQFGNSVEVISAFTATTMNISSAGTLNISLRNNGVGVIETLTNNGAVSMHNTTGDSQSSTGTTTLRVGTLSGTGVMRSTTSASVNLLSILDIYGSGTSNYSGTIVNGSNGFGTVIVKSTGVGKIILTGANTYTGGTFIEQGEVRLGDGGNTGSIVGNVSTGSVGGGVFSVNRSDAYAFGGTISGVGQFHQIGTGTTTLSAANSFSGGSLATAGTLLVTNASGAGAGGITLAGGNLRVNVNSGSGSIENAVTFTSEVSHYYAERAAGQSLALAASSNLGGINTSAAILAGAAGASGAVLDAQFATSSAAQNDSRFSDVFNLTGTGDAVFVLQLDIASAVLTGSYVGWLDNDEWVNAVLGNTGGVYDGGRYGLLVTGESGLRGYAGTYLASGASASMDYLGAWGYNAEEGTVWAVLNHNSSFAIVPEPSTAILFGLGAMVWCLKGRRRLVRI